MTERCARRGPLPAASPRLVRHATVLAILAGLGWWGGPDLRAVEDQAVRAPTGAPTRGRVNAERLLADLQTLAGPEMAGRLTGSDGGERAQAFIAERFHALGLEPVNGVTRQPFSFSTKSPSPQTFSDAVNLMGMVRGRSAPAEYVLVTAHFDHLGIRGEQIYFGADDNASGVAAMLAIAGWFSRHPAAASIVFIAFDGEEQGLQGARHFVAAPPIDLRRVRVVVNLDMVGRGDKNQIFVAGPNHYPALKQRVLDASAGRSITVTVGHDQSGLRGMEDWTQSSDHGPFHAARIPFLYFGVEDHADYHKPTDTPDKIPRTFYAEAADLILDVVERSAGPASR